MKKLFSVVTAALLSIVLSEMALAVDLCAQCGVQYERGERFCDRVSSADAEKEINHCIVRGHRTARIRSINFDMDLPELPTTAPFFDQQVKHKENDEP